jgi:hypothetical protein
MTRAILAAGCGMLDISAQPQTARLFGHHCDVDVTTLKTARQYLDNGMTKIHH